METKLTNQERKEIILTAIRFLEHGTYNYMCSAINFAIAFEKDSWANIAVVAFPELLEYKPAGKKEHETWFDISERQKRIDILTEIYNALPA